MMLRRIGFCGIILSLFYKLMVVVGFYKDINTFCFHTWDIHNFCNGILEMKMDHYCY